MRSRAIRSPLRRVPLASAPSLLEDGPRSGALRETRPCRSKYPCSGRARSKFSCSLFILEQAFEQARFSNPRRTMSQDSPRPIQVLIVDDHAVVRAGLRMLIDSQTGMKVVAEAGTRV